MAPLSNDDRITVLFVDDDLAVLRAIRRTLMDAPFDVLTATDGVQALEMLGVREVDVIVSDIDMPIMDGVELIKRVRREHPNVVRMLLTAAATVDRTIDAINEGEVHRFFVKPFDAERFQRTVEALVERIRELRRSGAVDARRARLRELHAWVEERFPGLLDVARNDAGEVLVDAAVIEASLDAAARH